MKRQFAMHMKTRLKQLVIGSSLLLAGLAGNAGPLNRNDVAADPVWLVHIDCDALRPTAIGRFILTEMEKPEAQAKLAAFQSLFSFDLRTQLHALTLYSTGSTPEDGILVVYADFDPARLTTLARAAKDAEQTSYNQNTIYSWIDDGKRGRPGAKHRTYAAIQGSRVIFAQRQERVSQALDVLTGAAANLASGRAFAQFGRPGSAGFVQAGARKMDFIASDPNAAILRLSKLVRFELGELQQQLTATLTLEANDEEVATNIASIAQGLVALMKLQKEKPESARFAEALALKQDGPTVTARLTLPVSEALELIKADAARKAQKKAARETSK
jgi:hypothetical protein